MATTFKYRKDNMDDLETIVETPPSVGISFSNTTVLHRCLWGLAVISVTLLIASVTLAVLLGVQITRNSNAASTFLSSNGSKSNNAIVSSTTQIMEGTGATRKTVKLMSTSSSTAPTSTTCKQCPPPNPCPSICTNPGCLDTASWMLTNRNESFDPCTDFYSYACRGWEAKHELRPSDTERTILTELADVNAQSIHRLLQSPTKQNQKGSFEYKVKNLYKSCINDFETMKAAGNPLIDIINDALGGWYVFSNLKGDGSSWNYTDAFLKTHVGYMSSALFTTKLVPDKGNENRLVIAIDTGGLGMTSVYYMRGPTDKRSLAYKTYMRSVAKLLLRDNDINLDDTTSHLVDDFVNDVFNFETKLANISESTHLAVNPQDSSYHNMTLYCLSTDYQMLFTRAIKYAFSEAALDDNTQVVVYSPDYIQQVSQLVNETLQVNNGRALHNYLAWRLMSTYAKHLSWEYVHAKREFDYVYSYKSEFEPLWQVCVDFVTAKMAEGVSALFARDHVESNGGERSTIVKHIEYKAVLVQTALFRRCCSDGIGSTWAMNMSNVCEVRQRSLEAMETICQVPTIHEIISRIKSTLQQSINSYSWMDSATKDAAISKIKAVMDKLRFSSALLSDQRMNSIYQDLTITANGYFNNVLSLNGFTLKQWNQKLKTGVSRLKWRGNPYDVNVDMYNPWNEIIVPSGVMQFPMFGEDVPKYMNYGSLGSQLARELIHAIDEIGQWYSPSGEDAGWWSDGTKQQYITAKQCIISLYNNQLFEFKLENNRIWKLPLRGRMIAKHAIAEIGGIKQAYQAYKEWERQTHGEPLGPGLFTTNDKAFFLAYAQTKCYVRDPNSVVFHIYSGKITNDILTNTALSQVEEFASAFGCSAAAKMNPPTRCNVF